LLHAARDLLRSDQEIGGAELHRSSLPKHGCQSLKISYARR
jgi:hypothetical protein